MRRLHKNFAVTLVAVIVVFCCAAFTPTPTADTMALPILMYHKVATNGAGKYVVTTKQLEADFQALIAAGYTPVFLREVVDWVEGQGELPAKPIVITFDDGQYNNLCYVLPLAQKYSIKYVINPVTAYTEKSINDHDTGNPRYSNLSWQEIKQGYDSGLVEYGNHTHDLHRTSPRFGVAKQRRESLTDYTQTLQTDIGHAQELLTACGIPTPTVFAYPFGKYSKETPPILTAMGFKVLLTCTERVNTITRGDPTCLQNLGRFNRSGNITTAQIMKKISY